MEKLRTLLKSYIRNVLRWAFADEMKAYEDDVRKTVMDRLAPIQAIDVNWHEHGKLIILARVGNQDIVKFIDIPPEWNPREYRNFIAEMEARYSTKTRWVDAPRGWDDSLFFEMTGIRA